MNPSFSILSFCQISVASGSVTMLFITATDIRALEASISEQKVYSVKCPLRKDAYTDKQKSVP